MQLKEQVKENFANASGLYDDMIKRIIPYYDEQHKIILNFAAHDRARPLKILDLGVGTGALSRVFLEAFPQSHVTGVDISENMLIKARDNLAPFGNRFTTLLADFSKLPGSHKYDLIASGLSIHHLNNDEKRLLFKFLPSLLNPQGVFILQDLVTNEDMTTNLAYLDKWVGFMDEMGIDSQNVLTNHREHDLPTTIENQVKWLKEAGFIQAFSPWHYLNLAILVAKL